LEDYAVNKRVAPSVELEAAIERLLAEGLADAERLGELGRLGARLAIQRAVEEEVDAFLGRTRYERTPEARGWRNGNRPRQVQTAEGELEIQVPQIRGAAEKFVSSVIPNGRTALRTRPLEALIIGIRCRCPRGCAVTFPADAGRDPRGAFLIP
jgi:putative transposase